jgi:hypothetical protein
MNMPKAPFVKSNRSECTFKRSRTAHVFGVMLVVSCGAAGCTANALCPGVPSSLDLSARAPADLASSPVDFSGTADMASSAACVPRGTVSITSVGFDCFGDEEPAAACAAVGDPYFNRGQLTVAGYITTFYAEPQNQAFAVSYRVVDPQGWDINPAATGFNVGAGQGIVMTTLDTQITSDVTANETALLITVTGPTDCMTYVQPLLLR